MEENNEQYVIDSSFALAYLLPDESHPRVKTFFQQLKTGEAYLHAPLLLPFEVANGLHMAVVRKRVLQDIADKLLSRFLLMGVELYTIEYPEAFSLANHHNLTVYDASYVWLARKKRVPLLTLDANLTKLAR